MTRSQRSGTGVPTVDTARGSGHSLSPGKHFFPVSKVILWARSKRTRFRVFPLSALTECAMQALCSHAEVTGRQWISIPRNRLPLFLIPFQTSKENNFFNVSEGEKNPKSESNLFFFVLLRFFWNIFEKLFSYVWKTQTDFFVSLFLNVKHLSSLTSPLTPSVWNWSLWV